MSDTATALFIDGEPLGYLPSDDNIIIKDFNRKLYLGSFQPGYSQGSISGSLFSIDGYKPIGVAGFDIPAVIHKSIYVESVRIDGNDTDNPSLTIRTYDSVGYRTQHGEQYEVTGTFSIIYKKL